MPTPSQQANAVLPRFASVDALRGFDMFWIVGGDYLIRSLEKITKSPVTSGLAKQMEHCEWDGFRFYDLIFPLFIFIVGVAIPFSLPKILEREGKPAALKRIAVRSAILFVLGILYMGGVANGFKEVYFAGVLQRIAGAYFFAALLFCLVQMKSLAWITAGLLIGYWMLLTFVPVPGIGMASYEQGKNLAWWIDQNFLPGKKFEGTLLSTMPAVANCLLGVFAGQLLQNVNLSPTRKVRWLLGAGFTSLAAGCVWGLQFPIIKLLWTSTYVLVACGLSSILLGLFHQIIEVWNYHKWAQPFVWIGMNAITIYLVSALVGFQKLANRFVGGDVAATLGPWADLTRSLVALVLVFAIVRFLYTRKIFLRL